MQEHLRDVLSAADQIIDATGVEQLRAFGLNPDDWMDRFRRVVRLAAAVHDLGKANNHFQGMVTVETGRIGKCQGLRHEWVSWLILQHRDVHRWLIPALGEPIVQDADWSVVLWAVTGHHPAFRRPSPPTGVPDGSGSEMQLQVEHADFQACLDWLTEAFCLDTAAKPRLKAINLVLSDALTQINQADVKHALLWAQWNDEKRFPGMFAFVAAVKNCLVAADVAGSALPNDITDLQKRERWIASTFQRIPKKSDLDAIIADRRSYTTDSTRTFLALADCRWERAPI